MLVKEIPKQTFWNRPPKQAFETLLPIFVPTSSWRSFVGASGIPFLWSLPWSCSFSQILAWAPWWTSFFLRARMWRPSDLPSPFRWWPCPEIASKEAGQMKRGGFGVVVPFQKGATLSVIFPWCWKKKMGFYILPGHIQQLVVCCFEEVLWRNASWLWVEGWAVEDVVTSLEACDIWTLFVDCLLLAKCCLDEVLVWWLTGGGH